MPNFNTTNQPIGQDNYPNACTSTTTPKPDASVVAFLPQTHNDWNPISPTRVESALNTLAARVTQNESDLQNPSIEHGELNGLSEDDHPQYLLADGSRSVAGDLNVIGVLEAHGLRAGSVTQGEKGTVTLTNSTQSLQLGTGAKLGALPGNGGGAPLNAHMAGWLRVYIGETIAAIPFWT